MIGMQADYKVAYHVSLVLEQFPMALCILVDGYCGLRPVSLFFTGIGVKEYECSVCAATTTKAIFHRITSKEGADNVARRHYYTPLQTKLRDCTPNLEMLIRNTYGPRITIHRVLSE